MLKLPSGRVLEVSSCPGPKFSSTLLEGDAQERQVCQTCGFVAYENPKIVVGSVVRDRGRVLLCRRAIEPRRGFWALPAGYLELNEAPDRGAVREAFEEAEAHIQIVGL